MSLNSRALLTFHHIFSSKKKEIIRKAAKEISIYGICKIGYPGVLAVEGEEGNIKRYIREIKVRLLLTPPKHSWVDSLSTVTALAIMYVERYNLRLRPRRPSHVHYVVYTRDRNDGQDEWCRAIHAWGWTGRVVEKDYGLFKGANIRLIVWTISTSSSTMSKSPITWCSPPTVYIMFNTIAMSMGGQFE